jgi:hypothetical protein
MNRKTLALLAAGSSRPRAFESSVLAEAAEIRLCSITHPPMRMYFRDELLLMLDRAGFASVDTRGGYAGEDATGDHDFLVYIART